MCVRINISSIYMDIELEDLSYKQKILKKKKTLLESLYIHKRNPDFETAPSPEIQKKSD